MTVHIPKKNEEKNTKNKTMETSRAVALWLGNRQRRSWIVAALVFAALLLMLLRTADPSTHVMVAVLCLLGAVLVAWLGGDLASASLATVVDEPSSESMASAVAQDLELAAMSATSLCAPLCSHQHPQRRGHHSYSSPKLSIVPLIPRVATLRNNNSSSVTTTDHVDPITMAPLPAVPFHQD